jgi:hypothetical protein
MGERPGEQLSVTDERDAAAERLRTAEEVVGRHRLHRFPAHRHAVKVLHGDDELAVARRAAAQAGLRPASYVAAAALASATGARAAHGARQDREALAELLHVRLAVHQYVVHLHQVAAELNSGGQAPGWLEQAVASGDRALERIDEAARLRVELRRSAAATPWGSASATSTSLGTTTHNGRWT